MRSSWGKLNDEEQKDYLNNRQVHQVINFTRLALACEKLSIEFCVIALHFKKPFDNVDEKALPFTELNEHHKTLSTVSLRSMNRLLQRLK